MRYAAIALGAALFGFAACTAISAKACEADHWITSVANDGQIVVLEDQTIWEIAAGDTVDTALWLAMDNIVVCDDELVNTDDNETVSARQLK